MDLSTQDILSEVRDASTSGEDENVFFLYVATPKKPPTSLHKKIIEPFLKAKGWQKVSFKNTGFRALYFLREADCNGNYANGPSDSCEKSLNLCSETEVVTIESEDDADGNASEDEASPRKKKRENLDESFGVSATQNATNHRSELKRVIEDYKTKMDLSFHVHIVLSRPIDYEEDFAELANTPNSVEY